MAVIVFASPKGGVGKSTSATILATELAARKAQVSVIDADPNRPLVRWAKLADLPSNIKVISNVTEDSLIDVIEEEEANAPFVIVDLEGSRSRMTSYAMSRASLVIIPCQGSDLDAVQAAAAVNEVRSQEKAFRLNIPFAVIFTRTSAAIKPRTLKAIEADLIANGVSIFNVRLHEREAFRAVHSFGGTLQGLNPALVRNIDAAIENASAFASEVVERLRVGRENK